MKKLISRVLIIACNLLMVFLMSLFTVIALRIGNACLSVGKGLFWTVTVIGGAIGLAGTTILSWFAVKWSYKLSEMIFTSKKGTRYLFLAYCNFFIFGIASIAEISTLSKHEIGENTVQNLIYSAIALIYSAFLYSKGKAKKNLAKQIQQTTNYNVNRPGTATPVQQKESYDDIRKIKELYDEGILTEEEYSKKKKDLLGI